MNQPDWFQAEAALQQIQVIGSDRNELVNIIGEAAGVNCIGIGTDAAVFTYDHLPKYAFKMYSDHALDKLNNENTSTPSSGPAILPDVLRKRPKHTRHQLRARRHFA